MGRTIIHNPKHSYPTCHQAKRAVNGACNTSSNYPLYIMCITNMLTKGQPTSQVTTSCLNGYIGGCYAPANQSSTTQTTFYLPIVTNNCQGIQTSENDDPISAILNMSVNGTVMTFNAASIEPYNVNGTYYWICIINITQYTFEAYSNLFTQYQTSDGGYIYTFNPNSKITNIFYQYQNGNCTIPTPTITITMNAPTYNGTSYIQTCNYCNEYNS